VSILESATPGISCDSMAAAATTGPASGPRPASSMPMTWIFGLVDRICVSLVRGTIGVTFIFLGVGTFWFGGCVAVLFVGDVNIFRLGGTILFFRLEDDVDAVVASIVSGLVVFGSDSLLATLGSGIVDDIRAASACKRGLRLLRSNTDLV